MPELPEVETIRQHLLLSVTNHRVIHTNVLNHKLRYNINTQLHNLLQYKIISHISRHGKFLLFHLIKNTPHTPEHNPPNPSLDPSRDSSRDSFIVCHLGMSGNLIVSPLPSQHKHCHVSISLSPMTQNTQLYQKHIVLDFIDVRRFGFFVYCASLNDTKQFIPTLGPDPINDNLDTLSMYNSLRKHSIPIKSLLMNQQFIAGVGNIYASEILWLSSIHPTRRSNRISLKKTLTLLNSTKTILNNAISMGGSSFKNYVSPDNKYGYFQCRWNAYQQLHEPCSFVFPDDTTCNGRIISKSISGRITFYCNKHQK